MLHQKQKGPSCYFVAACNALDIVVDRDVEREYNVYVSNHYLEEAAGVMHRYIGMMLPCRFSTFVRGLSEEIPQTGKGVIVVGYGFGGCHAVAYDSGMICDSMEPDKVFISFEEYNRKALKGHGWIIEIIPLDEKKGES